MSLSSPASWAAETNFQSRYPGGTAVTITCLLSGLVVSVVAFPVMPALTWLCLSCPSDEGAIHTTTPAKITKLTKHNATRFIGLPFVYGERAGSLSESPAGACAGALRT